MLLHTSVSRSPPPTQSPPPRVLQLCRHCASLPCYWSDSQADEFIASATSFPFRALYLFQLHASLPGVVVPLVVRSDLRASLPRVEAPPVVRSSLPSPTPLSPGGGPSSGQIPHLHASLTGMKTPLVVRSPCLHPRLHASLHRVEAPSEVRSPHFPSQPHTFLPGVEVHLVVRSLILSLPNPTPPSLDGTSSSGQIPALISLLPQHSPSCLASCLPPRAGDRCSAQHPPLPPWPRASLPG